MEQVGILFFFGSIIGFCIWFFSMLISKMIKKGFVPNLKVKESINTGSDNLAVTKVITEFATQFLSALNEDVKSTIFNISKRDSFNEKDISELITSKRMVMEVVQEEIRTGIQNPTFWRSRSENEDLRTLKPLPKRLTPDEIEDCKKVMSLCDAEITFINKLQQDKRLLDTKGFNITYYQLLMSLRDVLISSNVTDVQRETIFPYISKYLSKCDWKLRRTIHYAFSNVQSSFYSYLEPYQLQMFTRVVGGTLEDHEYQLKAHSSASDISDLLEQIQIMNSLLSFSKDLDKLRRLIKNKGMSLSFFQLLPIFIEIIDTGTDERTERFIDDVYQHMQEHIEGQISPQIIIAMVMKEYGHVGDPSSLPMFVYAKLLNKFGINISNDQIEHFVKSAIEERELEEFEKSIALKIEGTEFNFSNLSGRAFEEFLCSLFTKLQYNVATTPSSGDQGADLVVLKDNIKTVVQAKRYEHKVNNQAVQEVVAAKNYYKADKALVITSSSFTSGAIDLALSNDVELWDREKLYQIIKSVDLKL